ncbi:MAG: pyridine nucleotide-disulfide oxidoreductase [Fusobacteria bacterium]|nr:MAG: pyridine nucleotide-disulfide oxidoreductase [Fusobacteriota bacterium]
MKILIVGGVAGGASSAARLRRLSEENEIIMFERGQYISFANCGLPYHIGGVIKDRDVLLVETVEGMKSRFNIDVRVNTEVEKINVEAKTVIAKNLKTGKTYEESFDKILLSPGAEVFVPPIKGANSPRAFILRNMKDMDKIIAHVKKNNVKKAVVVGAGFIGIEIAENFVELDMQTTVVEFADQVLAPVDGEIAAQVHQNMKDHDVELLLGHGVTEIVDGEKRSTVKIAKAGEKEASVEVEAEIIILAAGVRPETKLAEEAGCEIHPRFGIKVNEYMETSVEDIYAVGDAVTVKHFINGQEINIPLAWPANRQGRLVADTMLGRPNKQPYNGTMGTSILKAFDYTVGATGLNEKALQRAGLVYGKDYLTITVNRNSNAGYYPGATPLTLKLIFTPEGKILGAQGIGSKGVDKRIDVIATAIKGGINVVELQDIELAYAPPFNSAKDPVNILGYYAENVLNNDIKVVRYNEFEALVEAGDHEVLDIRTADERELGFIPGSRHIDLAELRERINELDKEKTYIVYCQVGLRGYVAYRMLVNLGFKALNLDGGYKLWEPTSQEQSNIGIFEGTDPSEFTHTENKPFVDAKLIGEERTFGNVQTIELDACGLACPGPIMKTRKTMEDLNPGDILQIKSSELGFRKDIKTWAEKTGHKFLSAKVVDGIVVAQVQKLDQGNCSNFTLPNGETSGVKMVESTKNKQTMVVFSGDLDKVLASFIIANGALAMGKEVTLFFTFWGLNALRKENFVNPKKNFVEKMFGIMMPKGPNKLQISQMNFGGMGTQMIKGIMKKKNVESLPSLMKMFLDNGGKIIACDMSVDLMGFSHDELIDEVEYGGVAAFLGESEDSFSTLFI